jgi:xanthine dehydrogenase small subunit
MNALELTINGLKVDASGIDPNTTLLSFVRSRGLTGSKEGCAEGECGACAVAVLRSDANGGSRYEAVNACLCLVAGLAGADVLTIEGIGSSQAPHPAQQALMQGGSQCGYCTPGFAVSLFCEYHRTDRIGAINLESLCGNLCRCTGYRPIAEGASALGFPEVSAFTVRLEQPAPPITALEYAYDGRRLTRPSSLAELFKTLEAAPNAKLIAGGTDVLCEVNIRHARYEHLVSLEGIADLQRITWTDTALEIGAGVSISTLEAALGDRVPLLAELFPLYASRLIRNRATLGGNLGTASPIGDSSPVLLALGAVVKLESARGERTVPLEQFFTGFRKTALSTGEIVTAIVIPTPKATHQRFFKIAKRQ